MSTQSSTTTQVSKPMARLPRSQSNAKIKRAAASQIEPNEASLQQREPRSTKQELVLTLLARKEGASIDEVMQATGWQQHSVRGFFAGTVKKKLSFELISSKIEGEPRRYSIQPGNKS